MIHQSNYSEFRTRNWVEINDESRGNYDANNDIEFKTWMIRPSICDYSDAYIHIKWNITLAGTQRSEDVPLQSYFDRDIPYDNRTKIGHIMFLIYFDSAMSGMHLASGNIEKFP